MLSDNIIANRAKKQPIEKIAQRLGIDKKYLIPYGRYIAKIDLDILSKLKDKPQAKYILVTSITPTHLGEGKTITAIGLSMALNRLKKLSTVCIRQPSLAPILGVKGPATGGGYAQILPRQEINLHFTGDIHAVTTAHNVISAFLDNLIFRANKLNINPERIYWRRVIDISDRSLRDIKTKLNKDTVLKTGFDMTSASEIMAILALSKDFKDLRRRIDNIVLAETYDNKPITCKDIKISGLITALLREAIKPNLVQTIENTPCFVHTSPFGNIAHGNSSILADKIALNFSDFVVTEAGFGADCGAEKFFNIKCRVSKFIPDVAVLVCSIRALKVHSGKFKITPARPLDRALFKENISLLEQGLENLEKQIENIKIFGIPVVVAINRFETDTDREVEFLKKKAINFGAYDCCVSEVFKKGSRGGLSLAYAVISASKQRKQFRFLYPLDMPIKEKIKIVAQKIYGAKDVEFLDFLEDKIKLFTLRGWDKFPICMAKTQFSLSHDPQLKGRPTDFILPIRDIRIFAGAEFLSVICGDILLMPGLPENPLGNKIDIDNKGNITLI